MLYQVRKYAGNNILGSRFMSAILISGLSHMINGRCSFMLELGGRETCQEQGGSNR